MAIEKWLLGFGLWRFLGDLQRGVERAADAEDAFGDELARQDAHTRQVLDLLDRMDAVSDQPERLEQLECELRDLDIEAYWDYQQAVLAAQVLPSVLGRSVEAAQAVQKKKPAISARFCALGRVFSFMA